MKMGQKGLYMGIIATLALLVAVAGCSREGDGSFEKVKQAGVIRIASGPGYPPFTYYNAKKELAGFDVAMARQLAKRLGVKAELVVVPWETIIEGLRENKFDAILGSMSVTEEREKVVDFSEPYYYAHSQTMVPKDSPLKSVKELKNKTVGVMGNTTFEDDAKSLGIEHIKRYATNDEAIAALGRGELDAVITDDVAGFYAKNRMNLNIETLGDTLGRDKISIAVRKGDRSLRTRINQVIDEMRKDGSLQELVEQMASNKL